MTHIEIAVALLCNVFSDELKKSIEYLHSPNREYLINKAFNIADEIISEEKSRGLSNAKILEDSTNPKFVPQEPPSNLPF